MPRTKHEALLDVSIDDFYETIIQTDRYPEFVKGCIQTEDLGKMAQGGRRIRYHLALMGQSILYDLDHEEVAPHELTVDGEALPTLRADVHWNLIESNFFKKNTGGWTLESRQPNRTQAIYELDLEFTKNVPQFLLKQMIKSTLPGLVRDFAAQTQRNKGKVHNP